MRRALGLVLAAALPLAVAGCGRPAVTRPRLERAIAPTFARLYVQRAVVLGESGVTPASVAAVAHCDRGGPKVADVGPGADWICLITFHDAKGEVQTGKFEVQAKAGATYVAGGPSKLVGPVMLTDTHGRDVPNPTFEFDGAFDPAG